MQQIWKQGQVNVANKVHRQKSTLLYNMKINLLSIHYLQAKVLVRVANVVGTELCKQNLILFAVFINQTNIENINDLEVELVENYMLEEDLDTYELASLLTEEEITTINNEIFTETYDDAILEDYLLENADLEDIMDQ